jgi:hypothetical protein
VKEVFHRKNASQYLSRLKVRDNSLSHVRLRVNMVQTLGSKRLARAMMESVRKHTDNETRAAVAAAIERVRQQHNSIHVLLDVLVKNRPLKTRPPFGISDFECNNLVLDKNGFSIESHRIKDTLKLLAITQDIISFKAVILDSSVDLYRVEKMRARGWAVGGRFVDIRFRKCPAEDVCIICHEEFDVEHCKFTCCNALYHAQCLVDAARKGQSAMMNTEKCMICQHRLGDIAPDVCLLETMIKLRKEGFTIEDMTEEEVCDSIGVAD